MCDDLQRYAKDLIIAFKYDKKKTQQQLSLEEASYQLSVVNYSDISTKPDASMRPQAIETCATPYVSSPFQTNYQTSISDKTHNGQ